MRLPLAATFAGFAAVLLVSASAAEPMADLQQALPAGWQLSTTRDTLTIERKQPVRISGKYLANAPHYGNAYVAPSIDAPTETLRLRYRTEPAWSAARLAQVEAANAKIYAELAPLRKKYRIDDIATGKGMPLPANPDEERRLRDYEAAHAATLARITPVPRCTLGRLSVFDTEQTYRQLDLIVDPPIAMREAYAVVELVKRRCKQL